jgi:hypothetical protein
MKNKVLVFLVLVLLVSNIVMLYFYFKKNHKKEGRSQMIERMAKDIGFDAAQKETFLKQRTVYFDQMKPIMDSVTKLKKEYITKLMQQPNDSTLIKYTSSISSLMLKMDALNFISLQESKKICTGNQISTYDSIVKKIMLRMPGQGKK